jgi:hypothetical protein
MNGCHAAQRGAQNDAESSSASSSLSKLNPLVNGLAGIVASICIGSFADQILAQRVSVAICDAGKVHD